MKLKKVRRNTSIIFAVSFLVILLGFFHNVFFFIGAGILIIGFLYYVSEYSCPYCDESFYRIIKIPEYCPHCGKKLDE